MYIYEKYDYWQFEKRFKDLSRNQFPKGLRILYDYLEALAIDTGEPIELDVIALCCEYTESSIEDALRDYDLVTLEDLRDLTTVIEIDSDTIIYGEF